ncbi:YeeE/YedE family protein [Temperatibacter marinus]|uniref:YeeE/YedE family protein n=1 Tax=Temperatibacter marinus TaxID=1456591 RepID=A0AA52EFY8_9PROT|nr:YeeE/YedE family protein [Temperatibacter marinus]WND02110.1 YeeE/YedE family protein [Temperatibacter marinus]
MTIDLVNFTPITAIGGGILIGCAAILLMAGNKAIMGVSGIARSALLDGDKKWRLCFLTGIVSAAALASNLMTTPPLVEVTTHKGYLLTAGLLVGLGTSLGNGCTSGHGVCGLSRFSKRSFVAVCLFMATAMLTTYLLK